MDPSLILDKLSHGRDGGLAGLWEMRKIRASGLADRGSLFIQQACIGQFIIIITGPRADGQIQECMQYSSYLT